MRRWWLCGLVGCGMLLPSLQAAQISGEYLESRSCDIYTGPCFANGQIGLEGREAVMAWKVDSGTWNNVDLKGLSVVLVVRANDTLGYNPSFSTQPYPMRSVVLVDEKANTAQREALLKFVKESAPQLTTDITQVDAVPITLLNDHLAGKGSLKAGNVARIETRKMAKGDCICSNESVFYPPLTKVQNSQAAYSLQTSFEGEGLDSTWSNFSSRSAFLATFRK